MSFISIDFETRSTVDLWKRGVYVYGSDPTTDIWCMSYCVPGGEPHTWSPFLDDLSEINPAFIRAVEAGTPLRAWNAEFEFVIWNRVLTRHGFPATRLDQWYDTAAQAAMMALPRSLGKAAKVLGLDQQKDEEGYQLMRKMCRPRALGGWWVRWDMGSEGGEEGPFPTKAEANRWRIDESPFGPSDVELVKDYRSLLWWDDEASIRRLIQYCEDDVRTEMEVAQLVRPLPDGTKGINERAVFLMNQRMNYRGVHVDAPLVEAAQELMTYAMAGADAEAREITDGHVGAVTQPQSIREWVNEHTDLDLENLRKETVRDVLDQVEKGELELPEKAVRLLALRQGYGKTSTGKLDAFERCLDTDGRAHGLHLYHGASTGRWSGRLIQTQNFPRPEMKREEIEALVPAVLARDIEVLEATEWSIPEIISSMLRSMMKAEPGHILMGADYSQIEARVLAWIAEQEDLVELFASGGKVYEDMAAFLFEMDVEDVAKDSFERQIGKNSVLGAGYQMGADRFADQVWEQTGIVLDRGLDEEGERVREDLAAKAINGYRTKNHRIKQFWRDIEDTAIAAVRNPGSVQTVGRRDSIRFTYRGAFLYCFLPSGRALYYAAPEIRQKRLPEPYDDIIKPSLTFLGVDGYTRQWRRQHTYGGHLTENVVQAMARDLLAEAMLRHEAAGFPPVLTVHDETVSEVPENEADFEKFMSLMTTLPTWARDLPVAAEGWMGERFRK